MKKTNELFTSENVKRTMFDATPNPKGNEGEVAILKPAYVKRAFRPEYQTADYQLFRLETGFGCQPHTSGNACFGHFCIDGEKCRIHRYNFIGIADEATAAYAAELELKWQQSDKEQCEVAEMTETKVTVNKTTLDNAIKARLDLDAAYNAASAAGKKLKNKKFDRLSNTVTEYYKELELQTEHRVCFSYFWHIINTSVALSDTPYETAYKLLKVLNIEVAE